MASKTVEPKKPESATRRSHKVILADLVQMLGSYTVLTLLAEVVRERVFLSNEHKKRAESIAKSIERARDA